MKLGPVGEKIAVFKCIESGIEYEKEVQAAVINPTSIPHKELADAGMTDEHGMLDVNPYTL